MSATSESIACYSGSDPDWHGAVLGQCPSLRTGLEPAWLVRNSHIQNMLTLVRDQVAPPVSWDAEERLTMPDGGTVSIQWLGLDAPPDTPVVIVLHTVTGSADDLRRFIAAIRARLGWVVAACNRRGHAGLELTAPQINTLGSVEDFRRQIGAIETRRPAAPLYGVGVSAGSSVLVRYLGETVERSRIRAAVAVCPPYDIREAFQCAHRAYDRLLTRRLIRFFLHRNAESLRHVDGYDHCAAATTLAEFHDRLYPLAGFESREEFYLRSNPMEVAHRVSVPILVINAADDPLCVERNVQQHLDSMQQLSRMTLAVTKCGGHCGFFETLSNPDSWADRAIAEYLEAANRMLGGGATQAHRSAG
jgi:predicted alpha/beta-fold hydrolase